MHQLQISFTILVFILSTLFESHNKSLEHKIYCPEDMYGQEYLKFYNMTAFLTTWTTTNPNESITIPTTGGGYLYDVAWGDGTTSVNRTGNATHTYATPGDYQISITGSFPRIYFNNSGDKNKIKSIDQWGVQSWISMEGAFWGCQNLEELASDAPNLMNVTDMSFMFFDCILLNQELNNWDVSNVTDMSRMFSESSINQDIGNWDVSNVTDMSFMFGGTPFNQDIGAWNVSSVTNMEGMFDDSDFNQDIGAWNVSNVTNMRVMFISTDFNQDIGNWNVSSVTNMEGMFTSSQFNQNIGAWDVSSVTNMYSMFASSQFNQYIGNWDVSSVTNMNGMLQGSQFNQDVGNWNINHGPSMEDIFIGTPLSIENYDKILIGWAQQSPSSTTLGVGSTQYCLGAEARDELINTYGWTITDGGEAVPFFIDNTFTNNNGNNLWEDAGNWSLFSRPTAIHNVIIPSGMTCIVEDWFLPTTFEDGLCYTIEIEDGAVFEVEDGATFRTAVPCNY